MAIRTDVSNGIAHTYSTEGKRIRQKGTRFPVRNAYEEVGKQHQWEEVEDDE